MKINPLLGKIDIPYRWKLVDKRVIDAYPLTTHTDWDTKNYRYKEIKDRIKDHYSIEQNDHCVFCRRDINYKGWDEPIEHIIHKKFRYIWMFEPLNLALSCRHCNTKKSIKHALKKPFRNILVFSTNSNDYRIVHPHFDNFENFIYIEDNLFYRSINRDKGLLHISFFQLNGEIMLMNRAKDEKISRLDYYKKLTHKISDNNISRLEKKTYRKVLKDIINRRALN